MQKHRGIKFVEGILAFMMVAAFAFLVLGEMLFPVENQVETDESQFFEARWERVLQDGSRVSIDVPGNCEAEWGEEVVIETILPKNQEDETFCMRSLQQEMAVYVDGKLRKEYSTLDSQPFGKNSTMTYVFFMITEEDAGKTLQIRLTTQSGHTGSISAILVGERSQIWRYFIKRYAPAAVVAAFLFVLSVVVLCLAVLLKFIYKRKLDMVHLGNAVMLASAWLLVESKLRQFFLPNSTVAMIMGFMLVILLPYPVIAYINALQKYRYSKFYFVIQVGVALNGIIATVLQVLNIKDYFETMGISHLLIISCILLFVITVIEDIRKGYISEYKEVAIGFVGLMLAGVWEIYLVYVADSPYNGIALCLGLVILFLTAAMKTCRDIVNGEKERQSAIAASESKANFLANISHEIRTPINTIIGMNEMILRENKDSSITEYAKNAKVASQMLLGLVNDILDISKIDAGKLQIVDTNYSVATILKDVAMGVEVRAMQKNLKFNVEIDAKLPSVLRGDDVRIRQILNNLLSNAVKYTKEGSITFAAEGIHEESGFVLKMSVTDTGIGIRQEDMSTLFDSFQRLELKKNRYIEGTGLGLSITKQLVELMSGCIQVKSEVGKGSCFTVLIPQEIIDDTAIGAWEQGTVAEEFESQDEKVIFCAPEAKVLVVDDNRMNLKVIQALLKRSQVQVDMATGGNECLEMTKKKKYDLILMDHMMPEPDGVQTLHMMRNDKKNANYTTNVVVLTANAVGDVETEYRKKGFSDYLGKPIDTDKLEQILIKYLSARVKKK